MADGSYHPDDDGIAQGHRAIRMAVETRLSEMVSDKRAARQKFDRREQAARFILDGFDGANWLDVSAEIARRLTEQERVGLLMCVLKSLPEEIADQVVQGMFEPGVPSSSKDHKEAAAFWATNASQAEIKAFVHAGIETMPPETRAAMKDWLNGKGKK